MRTATIPAEVTSVEDRIAGNLNLTQIALLVIAVFSATAIFAILPPIDQLILYKIPVIGFAVLTCLILAIRIKGKVVLNWLITLIRYNLRPRYYVFNKNEAYLREFVYESLDEASDENGAEEEAIDDEPAAKKEVKLADLIRLESLLSDPNKKVSYKVNKKGGLDVAIE